MKKIFVMITLLVSLAIMTVSCRYGTAYWDCVSSCNTKGNALYYACYNDTTFCSLLVSMYKDSCKKGCE